jgi:tRNA(Ile)-lysidine synthase
LTAAVRKYIKEHGLLVSDRPVITGFSGGGDSTALLYLLNSLGYRCIAAHCNFHLRGEEASRDEEFTMRFAERLSLPYEKTDFDTAAYAKTKRLSLEMAARELRYEWFEKLREKYEAQAIAVAHHKDDNAETLLLNLLRGAGIHGLRAMRPRNGFVIRPLLCVNKEQVRQFLADNKLDYVNDSTNNDNSFVRNRLRLNVLPLLKDINPSVIDVLNRTIEHLSEAEIIFNEAVALAGRAIVRTEADESIELSVSELLKTSAPKTVLYELLRQYGFTRPVTEEIFHTIAEDAIGKTFIADGTGYRLITTRGRLIVCRHTSEAEADEEYSIESIDADLSNLPVRLEISTQEVGKRFELDRAPTTATFDSAKVSFPLTLRRWRAGDRFIPFGMSGSKKLSDFFADNKYSLHDKQQTWLLCSNNNIIWVLGKRIDNRYRVTANTTKALIIKYI